MFKSRLCFYINLDLSIYILQIYVLYIKYFTLKNKIFFVFEKIKSRLCSYKNLDFLQFLFISAKKIYFTNVFIKYQIFCLNKKYECFVKYFVCRLCLLINFIFLFNTLFYFFSSIYDVCVSLCHGVSIFVFLCLSVSFCVYH